MAIAVGSISGLRKGGVRYSKKQVIVLCLLAVVVGFLVPGIIKNLNSAIYQKILGVFLLLRYFFVSFMFISGIVLIVS